MDSPSGLSVDLTVPDPRASPAGCPSCGTTVEPAPPVNAATRRAEITRCAICGERSLLGPLRALTDCERCGLPFTVDAANADAARCSPCAAQGDAAADPALVALVEHGVRRAWQARERFVGEPHVDGYLERLVRRIASAVDGAPTDPRVALIDGGPGTGVLPSGLIVLEVSLLRELGDEAELAFVLARELVHVARGHVAHTLGGMALARLLDTDGLREDDSRWDDEAHDLLALGRGERQELLADAGAAAALVRLGYDPRAPLRAVRRDATTSVARPPVAARRQAVERAAASRATDGGLTNREPFRRAMADVDPWRMTAADPLADDARAGRISPGLRRTLWWLGIVFALAAGLLALAVALLW